MLDSTRNSSHLASIYGKDFLELVWESGQFHAGGGSSNNRTQNTPLCIGYSVNPSHKNEDVSTTKRARLSTSSHSHFDHHSPAQTQRDSDLSSSHQSNGQVFSQIDLQSSQSKSSYKSDEEFPNLRPLKDSNHMCTYSSSQQCLPSNPFKKPRIDSSQTQKTNSQKPQYLGCDQRMGKVNFSNFSIPSVFLKSTTYHQNSARNTSSARVEEIKSKAAVIESAKGSHGLTGFQEQTSFTANKSNLATLAEKSAEPPSSESLREKGKANTNLCSERASSSVCSLGASNDPIFRIKKHEEDTDDSTYFSDNEEEPENMVKEKPTHGLKKIRNTEIHNLSERKRRDKINEKIRTLKNLIPNCNKVDKASMLDDAIDYLKTLKLQLEIMSMGRGLCMPLMMLPPHHMNALQLMGAGMGFRPPQFPMPPLPGVTDNRLQMFGFSNQTPPMPIPNAPFINPMTNGNSSTQPLMEANNNLARHMANPGQLTAQEVSVPKNL